MLLTQTRALVCRLDLLGKLLPTPHLRTRVAAIEVLGSQGTPHEFLKGEPRIRFHSAIGSLPMQPLRTTPATGTNQHIYMLIASAPGRPISGYDPATGPQGPHLSHL
jgi:hypothetical protein